MRNPRWAAWQLLLTYSFGYLGYVPIHSQAADPSTPRPTVHVSLIDDESGHVTPAMVCITDTQDGTVRLPPDGRPNPSFSTTDSFTAGVEFNSDRNWIGPVRKMTGLGSNQDRSYVYEMIPSLPYWQEPAMYQTSGDFTISLTPGKYRIAVQHGCEFIPIVETWDIQSEDVHKTIRMRRWIDLAAEGWISGDVHVHHPTLKQEHRDFLLEYARAEDVRLVNILQQHAGSTTHSVQAGFGKKYRVERDGHWLVSGQETPSSAFGHIIGLNVEHYVDEPIHHHLYDLAFDKIHHHAGALAGYAHFSWNGCNLPRGFPWYVTTEKIDFVEVLQFAKINKPDYYDYLNMGFHLVAAAGSDVPWGSTMGEVRTYVHVDGAFEPDTWFAGLKAGHSFVTNGPAIELSVDDELPGTTLKRARGDSVHIRARLRSHASIAQPRRLQLISHDGVRAQSMPAGDETELVLELDLPLEESRWLVASADCENGAVAHTSPVYIVVDGQPTWSRIAGRAAIHKQMAAIEEIRKEFRDNVQAEYRADILKRLDMAMHYYQDLEQKMVGKRARDE